MNDMSSLCVVTTRMPGYLLRLALQHQKLPPDCLRIHDRYLDDQPVSHEPISASHPHILAPRAILLQQGGLKALHQLGMDTDHLQTEGYTTPTIVFLDRHDRSMVTLNTSLLSHVFAPLWIDTALLRQRLAVSAGIVPENRPSEHPPSSPCHHEVRSETWTRVGCPSMLLRIRLGALTQQGTYLVWDHPQACVGVSQLTQGRLLMFAVLKHRRSEPLQKTVAAEALDDVRLRLAPHCTVGPLIEEQWFPLTWVGSRPCWDGHVLHWGAAALRLHPLSGQWISYWAIQARRVAQELADHGALSPRFMRDLDRRNRVMFVNHLRMLRLHTQPTTLWQLLYTPYLWALRHSAGLRRRVMLNTGLLS